MRGRRDILSLVVGLLLLVAVRCPWFFGVVCCGRRHDFSLSVVVDVVAVVVVAVVAVVDVCCCRLLLVVVVGCR